jgi:hypothetical protein
MKRNFAVFVFCLFASIIIYSCTHVSGTYVSTNGSMAGRSMKGNCMDCHKKGATQGGFSVGGTVFNSAGGDRYPNGNVKLYSALDINGKAIDSTLVATIEVDGIGNFYTTHPIDLSQGVYAVVVSSQGLQQTMSDPITNGSCNSCHGVSTGNISVY